MLRDFAEEPVPWVLRILRLSEARRGSYLCATRSHPGAVCSGYRQDPHVQLAHRGTQIVRDPLACQVNATRGRNRFRCGRRPIRPVDWRCLAGTVAALQREHAGKAGMTDSKSCWRRSSPSSWCRGKIGEDIAHTSPMLVQYDRRMSFSHPEAEQRISNVRPISPQRFAARFES
jgi:hypothetical protein